MVMFVLLTMGLMGCQYKEDEETDSNTEEKMV